MKNKVAKRMLTIALSAAMAVSMLAGCGGGDNGTSDTDTSGKDASFTWWIYRTDGEGQYYENYEDSPIAQYINQVYWDVENGGLGTAENGTQLDISYLVPISGSEQENFNTMLSTGEYPELIDLVSSPESAQALYEEGILLDITDYVETYMPNYMAFLDANPELKPLVQVADDEGNAHYYAVYAIMDGVEDPWQGTCYRRDWVVKYAEPTEYVWDWESDYVIENGHPAVTPLAKALEEGDLEGWKENEVTKFTADYGSDPDNTYTDNVVFPSGTNDPITISDWEWMFEAFQKAIEDRGWSKDSSAYGTTVQYSGFNGLGDVTSSFGGGTGSLYLKDGVISYDGISENFKTYTECMQVWYENGWLDSQFNTRSNDIFFQINATGVSQGKVGMWDGLASTLGTAIRATCDNAEDAQDAFVMGAQLPINDIYGGEDQMYKDPDSLYQATRKGAALGITNKAKDKDLATLFTFLDWTYTLEGAETIRIGLSEEQYASVTLDPDLYAEYGLTSAFTESLDEDGNIVITPNVDASSSLSTALAGIRMDVGFKLTRTGELASYAQHSTTVVESAYEQWSKYLNTGSVLDYGSLLTTEETDTYNKIQTAISEYTSQNLPNVIKGTLSWEDYVKGFDNIDYETAVEIYQRYVELAKSASK